MSMIQFRQVKSIHFCKSMQQSIIILPHWSNVMIQISANCPLQLIAWKVVMFLSMIQANHSNKFKCFASISWYLNDNTDWIKLFESNQTVHINKMLKNSFIHKISWMYLAKMPVLLKWKVLIEKSITISDQMHTQSIPSHNISVPTLSGQEIFPFLPTVLHHVFKSY